MNCPACGADNREDARFCRRCGTDIGKAIPQPALDTAADKPVVAKEELRVREAPQADTEAKARAKQEGEPEVGGEEGAKVSRAGSVSAPEPPPDLVAEAAEVGQQVEEMRAAPEGTAATEGGPEGAGPGEAGPGEAWAGGATSVGGEGDVPLVETADEVPTEGQPAEEDEDLLELDGLLSFWREETEPIRPVEVGILLADRYQIMEALDVQKESILYQANDLVRCWQCGFEGNARGDAFCAKCGVTQDRRVHVRLLQVRDGDSELPEEETVAGSFAHDGQTFLLLAEGVPEPEEEASQVWGIHLLVGQRSDTGLVRQLDEDSLLCLTTMPSYEARIGPVLGLFSLADGMGGHEGGEMASKMAIQVLAEKAVKDVILPMMAGELVLDEDVATLLRQATIAANDAVYLARQKRGNDMGTTLTTVLVRDERLFVAHVGDSRAYRWNAQGLEQLTVDHSVVASMIAEGQIAPEEIYTHPHRSVVYRCVGDKPTVEVDTDMLPLAPGDRILLCSDGLWEMIRNEGIEDVLMQEADPQAAADLLVKHANVAGGEDNISVIVVQVETI